MKGAKTEPSAITRIPPSNIKTIIKGDSQSFLLYLRNFKNSNIVFMFRTDY